MLYDPAQFGDVVLVRFPFTNQTDFKRRPAVVISNVAYNASRPDVIIMAITSRLRETTSLGDVPLTEWQAAHLLKPSAIKLIIATIQLELVLGRLGTLHEVDQTSLKTAIGAILT